MTRLLRLLAEHERPPLLVHVLEVAVKVKVVLPAALGRIAVLLCPLRAPRGRLPLPKPKPTPKGGGFRGQGGGFRGQGGGFRGQGGGFRGQGGGFRGQGGGFRGQGRRSVKSRRPKGLNTDYRPHARCGPIPFCAEMRQSTTQRPLRVVFRCSQPTRP
eukprot:1187447-Prorocentrum_minimum.AAC.1